jgi:opacity protein-like surface antigen
MAYVMANTVRPMRGLLVSCIALLLLASPAFAGDQDPSANTSTQSTSAAPPPDFLLGRPRGSVGVRGSMLVASAKSDLFDFVTDVLAIEKSDFNTGSFGAEVGYSVTPRFDVIGTMDLNGVNKPSDYRDWEDNRGLPIQQTTELKQMNLTVSGKFSLLPRGRAISRLAWIPRTFIPYVGAGGGYGRYEFRQNGDFVDFDNGNRVFSDTFTSKGWAPTFHVLGGTDIQVYRHLMLSLDARYSWQRATLSNDFIDFEPIDLGGFRFGAGIHLAF